MLAAAFTNKLSKEKVNKQLIQRIEKYIELLKNVEDEKGIIFRKEYLECIKRIKDTSYSDFKTKIELIKE